VVSGTLYAALPDGASGLRLEDPRLPMMMAAPGRTDDAPEDARTFVYLTPAVGTVYLWESWLRHEVPVWTGPKPSGPKSSGPKSSGEKRVSISFNYS
jgi:uncharacterized protein (TIGR02466 family)